MVAVGCILIHKLYYRSGIVCTGPELVSVCLAGYEDADAKALIDANFTGITLGNAMKMGVMVNASGNIDYTTVDNVLAAMPAGMKLYIFMALPRVMPVKLASIRAFASASSRYMSAPIPRARFRFG